MNLYEKLKNKILDNPIVAIFTLIFVLVMGALAFQSSILQMFENIWPDRMLEVKYNPLEG